MDGWGARGVSQTYCVKGQPAQSRGVGRTLSACLRVDGQMAQKRKTKNCEHGTVRPTVGCVSRPLVPCHARRAHGTMAAAGRRRDDQTCVGFPRPHFCSPSSSTSTSPIPRICHSAPPKCAISCTSQSSRPRRQRCSRLPGAQAHLPSHCPRSASASASPTPGLQGHPRDGDCCIPLQNFIRFLSAANPPTATNGTSADPTKSLQGETPDAFLPPRPTTEKTTSSTRWLNTRTLWRTPRLHLVSRRDGIARGAMVATRDDYPDNARLPLGHSSPRFQTSRTRRERWTRI